MSVLQFMFAWLGVCLLACSLAGLHFSPSQSKGEAPPRVKHQYQVICLPGSLIA